MNTPITCQDWNRCLEVSETQELAKWIYDNLPTLDAEAPPSYTYEMDAANTIYNFLNQKLLPEIVRTLESQQLDPQTYATLTLIASRINVQFENYNSWLNVRESLREHTQTHNLFDSLVTELEQNGFPVSNPTTYAYGLGANNGYVLASPRQSPYSFPDSTTQDFSEPMEQEVPRISMPDSDFDFESDGGYGRVTSPVSTTKIDIEMQTNLQRLPISPPHYLYAARDGNGSCSGVGTSYITTSTIDEEMLATSLLPSSAPHSFVATGQGYVRINTSPAPVTSTLTEEMLALNVQPLSPVLLSDPASNPNSFEAIKQQISTFNRDLNQWKIREELKEQQLGPGIAMLNAKVLDTLEGRSTDIIIKILNLMPQEPSLRAVLEDFIKTLLVVTQQPERVLIYKTKFVSKLRILIKSELLSGLGLVDLVLWNQEKEDALKKSKKASERKIVIDEKKACIITGNRLEIKISIPSNPDRMDKSEGERSTVHDEFFWLHYTIQLKLAGYATKCKKPIAFSATSFPVKVTVHANQYLKAWETVIWSNAGNHFDVYKISERAKSLPFAKVYQAINVRFLQVTGRILSAEDFRNVARTLIQDNRFENDQAQMSFQQDFRREMKLNDLNLELPPSLTEQKQEVSFWGWWCHLEKFINKHLQIRNGSTVSNLWKDGKITGYSDLESIDAILNTSPPGTFVLRFSLATPNGITVQFKSSTEGILSTRFTGKELTDKLNLQRSLDGMSPWKTLHCPSGERIDKSYIFKCERPPAPCAHASQSEQVTSPRSPGGRISQLPRYVYAKIKLSWSFER